MSNFDWRLNIDIAVSELRRLKAAEISVDAALDALRGRDLTLPAVQEALIAVEHMDVRDIQQLFETRGYWDDF